MGGQEVCNFFPERKRESMEFEEPIERERLEETSPEKRRRRLETTCDLLR